MQGLRRTMRVACKLILAGVIAGATGAAFAATPLGGLTVAVSAKGDKLVAGGDTRTLLVLDPQTLAVKERVWIETTIVGLAFSPDGATLAVQDTDGSVLLYETAGWKKKAELRKRDRMSVAPQAGIFAGLERGSSAVAIHIHAIADGAAKGVITLPKNAKVATFGLSADGKKLAVLIGPNDTTAEQKVAYNAVPKDLRGAARDEFMQKNDGKASDLMVYDVASGKPLAQSTVFYSHTDTAQMLFHGADVLVVNYTNVAAKMTPDGKVTIFKTETGYNYGIGFSPDHSLIMTGGLRGFALTKPDALTGVKGELPRISGWPEYFKGFDATPGAGAIYAATTGYRVARIGADGKVLAVMPVR